MKRAIELKEQKVNEISEILKSSSSFIIFEYMGLDAEDTTSIRKKMYTEDTKMIVLKNNITNRSLEKINIKDFGELTGPNAIAYSNSDQVAPLRFVNELLKSNDFIKIKGSVIDGTFYDAQSTLKIATLPSREGMYSMLLSCLTAPIRNFLYGIKAVSEKK